MIKLLIAFSCISLGASISMPLTQNSQQFEKIINEKEQLKFLKNDVLENSIKLGNETLYEYNGSEYRSRDNIIKEELNKNPIEIVKTISNPNKIIKNYATNELDGQKVYGLKSNDLVKVYKNALGKAVLPSCSEINLTGCVNSDIDAKNRSLNSYVNGGLIRNKYSYNQKDWFDSIQLADEHFNKSNFTVKNSLFYYHNGQYFNAFNNSDKKRLQAQLDSAYRYKFSAQKNEDWSKDKKLSFFNEEFSIEQENFFEYFKNELKTYFMEESNQKNIIGFKNMYNVEINSNKNNEGEEQWFTDFESTFNKDYVTIDKLDSSDNALKLEIKINESSSFNVDTFVDYIENVDNWTPKMEHGKCGGFTSDKQKKHVLKYVPDEGNQSEFLAITLKTHDDGEKGCPKGYKKTAPGKITLKENYSVDNFAFEYNERAGFFNELVNIYDLNKTLDASEIINYMLEQENLVNENYTRDNLIHDLSLKSDLTLWNDFKKNSLFDWIWNQIFKKLTDENIKSNPVQKDWKYGPSTFLFNNWTKAFSFNESNETFQNKFNEDIKEKNLKKEVTYNYQGMNFSTTVENWKNNFYALEYDAEIGGIPLRRMYYVENNTSSDISEFSDILGTNICKSEDMARKIASANSLKTLKKGFLIYDINGSGGIKDILIADNEEDAKNIYKQKISLDYKLIHKDELKIIRDQDVSMNDLISNKEYYIYKFKAKNGNEIYFKDYNSAKMIYENQISLIGGISEINVTNFSYSIKINGEEKIYKYSSRDNIDKIISKIFNDIKGR